MLGHAAPFDLLPLTVSDLIHESQWGQNACCVQRGEDLAFCYLEASPAVVNLGSLEDDSNHARRHMTVYPGCRDPVVARGKEAGYANLREALHAFINKRQNVNLEVNCAPIALRRLFKSAVVIGDTIFPVFLSFHAFADATCFGGSSRIFPSSPEP